MAKRFFRILAHAQLTVAIREDAAIESRADQGVLESPLKEVLNNERLELNFHLEFSHFALELIGSHQRGDLRKPRQDGLHLHFATKLLLLPLIVVSGGSFLGFAGTAAFEFVALGRNSGIPLEAFPFVFESLAGGVETVIVLASEPGRVNLVCNGVAQVRILLISRSFCQELKRFVGGSRRDSAGRKLFHDLLKERLILGFRRGDRRRRIQVLFEARFKKRLLLMFQLLPSQVAILLPGSKKGTSFPRKVEPPALELD